jgi:glycogen operon protein
MIQIRNHHPNLSRRRFFSGRRIRGADVRDISWYRPDGELMTEEEWSSGWARSIGVCLAGQAIGEVDELGEPVVDDTLFLLFNASDESLPFTPPEAESNPQWELIVDTANPSREPGTRVCQNGEPYNLQARSVVLLCWPRQQDSPNSILP